jgi:hypothetical protein
MSEADPFFTRPESVEGTLFYSYRGLKFCRLFQYTAPGLTRFTLDW